MTMQKITPQQITAIPGEGWVQSFPSPGAINPVTGWSYFNDAAALPVAADRGISLSGVSRTFGTAGAVGNAAIGVLGGVMNDRAGAAQGWAGYFDAIKALATAGTVVGVEIEIANLPGASPLGGLTPYKTFVDGMTRGLAVSAGSDASVFGRSYAADAAITVGNNGGAFWAGLVFRHNALMREGLSDDTTIPTSTGYAHAIQMGHDHGVTWFSRDNNGTVGIHGEAVRMWSSVDSATTAWGVAFGNSGIDFQEREGAGNSLFVIDYVPNASNFLAAVAGASGQGVRIQARGLNANVGLSLEPKGDGGVYIPIANVGSYANDAAAAAGGIAPGGIYHNSTIGALAQRRV